MYTKEIVSQPTSIGHVLECDMSFSMSFSPMVKLKNPGPEKCLPEPNYFRTSHDSIKPIPLPSLECCIASVVSAVLSHVPIILA